MKPSLACKQAPADYMEKGNRSAKLDQAPPSVKEQKNYMRLHAFKSIDDMGQKEYGKKRKSKNGSSVPARPTNALAHSEKYAFKNSGLFIGKAQAGGAGVFRPEEEGEEVSAPRHYLRRSVWHAFVNGRR